MLEKASKGDQKVEVNLAVNCLAKNLSRYTDSRVVAVAFFGPSMGDGEGELEMGHHTESVQRWAVESQHLDFVSPFVFSPYSGGPPGSATDRRVRISLYERSDPETPRGGGRSDRRLHTMRSGWQARDSDVLGWVDTTVNWLVQASGAANSGVNGATSISLPLYHADDQGKDFLLRSVGAELRASVKLLSVPVSSQTAASIPSQPEEIEGWIRKFRSEQPKRLAYLRGNESLRRKRDELRAEATSMRRGWDMDDALVDMSQSKADLFKRYDGDSILHDDTERSRVDEEKEFLREVEEERQRKERELQEREMTSRAFLGDARVHSANWRAIQRHLMSDSDSLSEMSSSDVFEREKRKMKRRRKEVVARKAAPRKSKSATVGDLLTAANSLHEYEGGARAANDSRQRKMLERERLEWSRREAKIRKEARRVMEREKEIERAHGRLLELLEFQSESGPCHPEYHPDVSETASNATYDEREGEGEGEGGGYTTSGSSTTDDPHTFRLQTRHEEGGRYGVVFVQEPFAERTQRFETLMMQKSFHTPQVKSTYVPWRKDPPFQTEKEYAPHVMESLKGATAPCSIM